MQSFFETINSWVWSPALVYLCLGAGLYFSVRTRFMQVRGFAEMLRLMFGGRRSEAGVSPFQALAMSLSGRVGVGNIAGVATAITFGGPGAVFWMWLVAFLGASTSFIESTLAQIYKEKDERQQYRGGPAYYIEKAMGLRWYAWLFALVTVLATGFLLPGVQANAIAASLDTALGIPRLATAAALLVALGFIIIGGVRRIASFAQVVVPFMAVGYILVAIIVMVLNAGEVPRVLALIIRSAFGMEAAYGAVIGLAVEWGVKRGVYSNEAGQGTGPHAAAAAENAHPAQQGFVQAFSIYVDTLLVCSATAFMILITGKYNVYGPDNQPILEHLPGVEEGPAYAQHAVESVIPGFGHLFVALALLFFAFTTIVAYYYMAETNVSYMNRHVRNRWFIAALRLLMLVAVGYGTLRTASAAWTLGDIGVGLMAWFNLIAILILQKPALLALRDYEQQRHSGRPMRFDPEALGIRNADLWSERIRRERDH
jgi:AGCS family alanine or glycine:cation symporter